MSSVFEDHVQKTSYVLSNTSELYKQLLMETEGYLINTFGRTTVKSIYWQRHQGYMDISSSVLYFSW